MDLTRMALDLPKKDFRELLAKNQPTQSHRMKMAQRRQAQRDRAPGFTAVRNQRLVDYYEGQKVIIAFTHTDERGECILKPAEIEQKALNNLRNSLPSPKQEKRHRQPRPSKSDNPVYRAGAR